MPSQRFVFTVELERETDARWIAEVLELPGVMVYGTSPEDAFHRVKVLALQVVADMLEHGELGSPAPDQFEFRRAA